MVKDKTIIGMVGSPDPKGRTFQLVAAALRGAQQSGVATELIQMVDHRVNACRDCLPWLCKETLKCEYRDDGFKFLCEKILNCSGLILGTPVYWWDSSGLVKYFILKMFRLYAKNAPLQGLPAFGIAIAGGTGNGLVSGLRQIYHFFQVMQMRALSPIPSTRFNFMESIEQATSSGRQLGRLSESRRPFKTLEERLLWYDTLPYINLSRAQERRLLAGICIRTEALSAEHDIALGLARADELEAAGKPLDAMVEISSTYQSAVKAFDADNGNKNTPNKKIK